MLTVEGEVVRVVKWVLAFNSIVVDGLSWINLQGKNAADEGTILFDRDTYQVVLSSLKVPRDRIGDLSRQNQCTDRAHFHVFYYAVAELECPAIRSDELRKVINLLDRPLYHDRCLQDPRGGSNHWPTTIDRRATLPSPSWDRCFR